MYAAVMPKEVIDISEYWPVDETGRPRTVNSVWTSSELNPHGIGRYTLQNALEGDLTKAGIDTIRLLIETCSMWSGKTLGYEDLVKKIDD